MSEAIRWCGVTLNMNAPYLDPDDVTAARARLALTDDDLAVLDRVKECQQTDEHQEVWFPPGATVSSAAFLMRYLLTGELR